MKDKNYKKVLGSFEEFQKQLQEMLNQNNLGNKIASLNISKEQDSLLEETKKHSNNKSNNTEDDEILKKIQDFNLKPKEVRDFLNKSVIQQLEAKKVLSVAICDHYNHVRQCLKNDFLSSQEYNKQNILITGPTGVGKTYLMRNIAKLIGVPFIKADATKFSETGYIGNDVEDLIRDLVKAANGNIKLAQCGIIYIDEIDKIAINPNNSGRDVSGRGVQNNLLKLMEDTDVNLISPQDLMSQMQNIINISSRNKNQNNKPIINTRHILFIFSGSFDNIINLVQERLNKNDIGFKKIVIEKNKDESYVDEITTNDFIKFGLEPEFIGRIPVRVKCESLTKDDLVEILISSKGSILDQYKNNFLQYDISFEIEKEAIDYIAEITVKERTGARGLLTILEYIFREFKFELPSSNVKFFKLTLDTIKNPKNALKQLINSHQL